MTLELKLKEYLEASKKAKIGFGVSHTFIMDCFDIGPKAAELLLEAVEILESIGNDFYNKDGKTIKDFSRESLEEIVYNDTNMAKSFVEMVKGKK